MISISKLIAGAMAMASIQLLCVADVPRLTEEFSMQYLNSPWGNARLKPGPDHSLRLESIHDSGAAALVAARLKELHAGDQFELSFEARGTVRLQVLLQFFNPETKERKRVDLVMPTPLNSQWQKIERRFTVPPGFSAGSLDFLIWKQIGYAELRNYSLKAPLRRGNTVLFQDRFGRGAFINNRFSEQAPACWRNRNAAEQGALTTREALTRGGKSLLIVTDKSDSLWQSLGGTLPRPLRPMQLDIQYKTAPDFAQGAPFIRIVYCDPKEQILPQKEEFSLNTKSVGTWQKASFPINTDRIPAAAAGFRLELGVKRLGERAPGKFFVGEVQLLCPELDGNFARIRCERDLNWYRPGETVRFRALGQLPKGCHSVIGTVRDSGGKTVAVVPVAASDFYESGWGFPVREPGFYEVEFSARTPAGDVPLAEEFSERARNEQRGLFVRAIHSFAVVEENPEGKKSNLFGFQLFVHPWQIQREGDLELRIAKQVGCRFTRFGCKWSIVEPEKGKFQWDTFDWFLSRIEAAGLESVVGLTDTPRWASRHPEDDRYVICVWAYNAYAPAKLEDWTNFVRTMAARYKGKITEWEVWNESNLPGRSCFWHDTPENYVKLLKSAHAAIKEIQPEAKILAGGWNSRYLPFYEKIMALGAGNYIDLISLHGSNNTPAAFHAVARKNNAPVVPWVNTEWHWGLIRHDYQQLDWSEERLTAAMMRDFLFQLQQGVREINIFEAANHTEKEALRFHAKGGDPLCHAGGTFRRKPYPEPRLAAVVFGNMHRHFFTGTPVLEGFYRFGNQKAIRYRNDSGPMLVFWHDTDKPVKLDPRLKQALTGAKIRDWEGKYITDHDLTLRPYCFYYAADVQIPVDMPQDLTIFKEEKPASPLEHKTQGVYSRRPILDAAGQPIAGNIRWNSDLTLRHWNGVPREYSKPTRFAVALADGRLQIIAETADSKHFQPAKVENDLWRGDCLELAFDPEGKGLSAMTLAAAKTEQGDWLYKGSAPTVVGDCPTDWTAAYNLVKTGRCVITHDPQKQLTRYCIDLPETELYPFVPKPGQPLRFSLLVGENNGRDRIAVVHWAGGIVGGKNYSKYGDLKPEPAELTKEP